MKLDSTTVEAARDRDGNADPTRPDRIDDILDSDTLGHNEGEPLVGDSYGDYPSREELTNPNHGEFIRDILSHHLVGSLDDAASELTGATDSVTFGNWKEALETATEIHGLDVDNLLTNGEDSEDSGEQLEELLGYEPLTDMKNYDNPLLVAELYTLGLSVVEVSNVLEEEVDDTVRPDYVRDSLKDVDLLNGKTRDEQREAFRENDSKIGGTTIINKQTTEGSKGLTVNTNDFG